MGWEATIVFFFLVKRHSHSNQQKRRVTQFRAVHGSGQVGFGPDPDSTRLNRVTKIATRNRPDIWGRPDGSGHQLIGSDWSVLRVWAWVQFGLNL